MAHDMDTDLTVEQARAHILIVDDDERIRGLLQKFLIQHGYWASVARDAAHARRLLEAVQFDLIVLDVMMPGEDGLELTRALRGDLTTPILLLTAKGEPSERIEGLESGADDYMAKPFEPKELVLRISAILRRTPSETPSPITMITMGAVRYDTVRNELWHGEERVRLTATESALMKIFSAKLGVAISREMLAEGLAQQGAKTQERAIDVQITRLRRKLEVAPKSPRYLQTVRGEGYVLMPDF